MTVSIHIEAMSAEEARETMRALLAGGSAESVAAHTAPAVEVSYPAQKPARRGRKPAPEPEQPVTDIDASGDEVPADRPERPQPSEDDVRAAIRGLVKAHGENAAWALLDKYGATKRSEIKDTRGFVEEAEYLVGLAFDDVVKRLPQAAKPEEKPE